MAEVMLEEAAAMVNVKDKYSQTALHRAVVDNNPDQIKILLLLGADIEARAYFGRTPLHLVVVKNERDSHFEVISLLLEAKANVDAKDELEETPLHILVEHNSDARTLELLLSYKPDLSAKDYNNKTPLVRAVAW